MARTQREHGSVAPGGGRPVARLPGLSGVREGPCHVQFVARGREPRRHVPRASGPLGEHFLVAADGGGPVRRRLRGPPLVDERGHPPQTGDLRRETGGGGAGKALTDHRELCRRTRRVPLPGEQFAEPLDLGPGEFEGGLGPHPPLLVGVPPRRRAQDPLDLPPVPEVPLVARRADQDGRVDVAEGALDRPQRVRALAQRVRDRPAVVPHLTGLEQPALPGLLVLEERGRRPLHRRVLRLVEMRSRAVAMASSIVLLAAMPFRSSGLNAPAETSLTFPRIATTAGTPSPISACASPEKGSRCELSAPEQRLRATRRSRWALRSIALSRSAGTRSTPPPSVSRDTTPLPSSSLYAPWAISSTAVGSSPWSASAASRPARVARSTTVVCTATSGRSCRSAAISAEARRGARPAGDAQATRSLIRLGSSPGSGRRWP
ncbi:hypothetical protein SALBM135S_08702 [Streptomyces alboniger]